MPKYEFAISVKNELEHTVGKVKKKEGDIIGLRPYPRNCGRKVIDEYLIVIVECPAAHHTQAHYAMKQKLTAPLWENGLVEWVDFERLDKDHGVSLMQYPRRDYDWDIQAAKPIKRVLKVAKRRHKIPLNILGNIDMAKIQNKSYVYQPFKKATQLVKKLNGLDGNKYLSIQDVDCVATGIGAEQEVTFQWNMLDNLVMDKYNNSYIAP